MKTLLILTVVLACNSASGQTVGRVSSKGAVIGPILATLPSTIGWTKTDQGQWVSAPGKIVFDAAWQDDREGNTSLGRDNYLKIEIRDVLFGGKKQKLFLIHRTEGAYKYRAILKDWYAWESVQYVILKEVPKIIPNDIEFNKAYVLNFPTKYVGAIPIYQLMKSDAQIRKTISTELITLEKEPKLTFQIGVFPVLHEGKKKARFIFRIDDWTKAAWINDDLRVEPKTFDSHYYEMDWDTFAAFWKAASK